MAINMIVLYNRAKVLDWEGGDVIFHTLLPPGECTAAFTAGRHLPFAHLLD
jgi:hypothetical protein